MSDNCKEIKDGSNPISNQPQEGGIFISASETHNVWPKPGAAPAVGQLSETLYDEEINTLLSGRFGVSSVTGLDDIAWLTRQLNKLVDLKRSEAAKELDKKK